MYDYLIEKNGVSEQELKNDTTKESYRKLASETLQQGGYTVKTTIDKNVYNAMQNAVAQYGSTLDQGSSQQVDVGNVLMDNSTGAILGFIGGRIIQPTKITTLLILRAHQVQVSNRLSLTVLPLIKDFLAVQVFFLITQRISQVVNQSCTVTTSELA